LAFSIEKSIEELGEKITEDEKNTITPKIEALKKAVEAKDLSTIETCKKELTDAWYPIIASKNPQSNGGMDNSIFGDMFKNGGGFGFKPEDFAKSPTDFGTHGSQAQPTQDTEYQTAEEVK
jgi:hypothetical protein